MEGEDKQLQQQQHSQQDAQQDAQHENANQDNYDEAIDTFEGLNLRDELLRGIYGHGFDKPSAIQQRGIKPILDGDDTIGQAQSGTGKTATFVIASLQKIDYDNHECQVLILAPTRELAQQIQKVRHEGVAVPAPQASVPSCAGGPPH